MIIRKTFRCRLEPNACQRRLFARFAGCCRFIFNHGLAARMEAYKQGGKTLSYADQCRDLTRLKKAGETAWLGEIHSQVLQQSLKDLDSAYRHFFLRVKKGEKLGFPRFKKKGLKDSFRYPQGINVEDGKVLHSRPIEGEVLQATVKREGEHWFVSLACEVELPDPAPIPVTEDRAVGIDVGLKTFAVLSDGTGIGNPRFLAKALGKLRKAQRRLSRKAKGSNNHKKQAVKVARLHAGVKNCHKDFAHKCSTAIVKNHDVIAVQTCSACGEKKPMPLDVRSYSCGNCGLVVDRDWNASMNIRAAGLSVLNACGGAQQWRPR